MHLLAQGGGGGRVSRCCCKGCIEAVGKANFGRNQDDDNAIAMVMPHTKGVIKIRATDGPVEVMPPNSSLAQQLIA